MSPGSEALVSTELPPQVQLVNLTTGGWVAQMIAVAARLRIADLLQDGPRQPDDLARAAEVDPDALYRLLRALASVGIFAEAADGRFQLTPLADCLRTGVPGSMRSWALAVMEDHFLRMWQELLYSVKTGRPAYDHVHGMGLFDYFSQHPDIGKTFDEAMTSLSSTEVPAVIRGYDFSGIRKLVDVAGGHGSLLCAALKANAAMRGALFDMPSVVPGSRSTIEAEGLAGRCEVVGGDMFQSLPAGGDAYMMKHIIHDWDDERSIQILKNCRSAMTPDGKILIVETVIKPGNDPDFFKLLDIAMLTISGRERTEEQFRALLGRAGLRLTRVVPTESALSVVEAVPA
jgi:hypothetical protein